MFILHSTFTPYPHVAGIIGILAAPLGGGVNLPVYYSLVAISAIASVFWREAALGFYQRHPRLSEMMTLLFGIISVVYAARILGPLTLPLVSTYCFLIGCLSWAITDESTWSPRSITGN